MPKDYNKEELFQQHSLKLIEVVRAGNVKKVKGLPLQKIELKSLENSKILIAMICRVMSGKRFSRQRKKLNC